MNRSTFRSLLFAAASAVVAVAPMAPAGAQSTEGPILTPEQVRAEYLQHGFRASEPLTWWTDGSTTFTVEDSTERGSPSGRILLVIVYPDAATAEAGRRDGAHLVPGYGPSIFRGNVALVQTTRAEQARRYAAEVARDDPTSAGIGAAPEPLAEPSSPVGLDFLAVVQGGLADL